jgi:hypothetical protein
MTVTLIFQLISDVSQCRFVKRVDGFAIKVVTAFFVVVTSLVVFIFTDASNSLPFIITASVLVPPTSIPTRKSKT